MDKTALLLEAEKRGLLPKDKEPILAEARKRGLIPERGDFVNAQGQKIYSHQDEISKPRAAWDATKAALGTPIPGLDQFGRFLSQDAPGYIAEKSGMSHFPFVRGAGIVAAGTLGTVGEMVPRKVGDVAAQAIAGPVLEGAGAAVKSLGPVKDLAAKISTSFLARDIGVPEAFIENVRKHTDVLKNLSEDMSVVYDHAKSLGEIMKRGVERLGTHIHAVEEKFIESKLANPKSLTKIPIDDIAQRLQEIKFKKGVEGSAEKAAGGLLDSHGNPISLGVPRLSEIDSIVGGDADKINGFVGEIKKIKDNANVIDLLRLKRRLGDEIAWGKGDEVAKKIGSQTNGVLKSVYQEVQDKIHAAYPELKEADMAYSEGRKQYDILQRKIFGTGPEEAYNRVKTRIQRGIAPQALIERASKINHATESAMRGLIDRVSAQQFAPIVRRGITGEALGVGGVLSGTAALMGHGEAAIIVDLAVAALTSPRLAALGIRATEAASSAIAKSIAETSPKVVETGARIAAQAMPKADPSALLLDSRRLLGLP